MLVQFAQPLPSITHVELVVPAMSQNDNMHFATYINERANWGNAFSDSRSFYLGNNAGNWRAIPIVGTGLAQRVRTECDKHTGTAYSIAKYLCAIPPIRSLAFMLSDASMVSAHCASLTARILKRAVPEVFLEHSSSWYGPSTLFIRLSSASLNYGAAVTTTETEDDKNTLHHILNESDDNLRTITTAACCKAIKSLALRACEKDIDSITRRVVQKQLATALLRYSIIVRSSQSDR